MKPANKASEIDRIAATIDRAVAEQRLPLKRIVTIEPNEGAII